MRFRKLQGWFYTSPHVSTIFSRVSQLIIIQTESSSSWFLQMMATRTSRQEFVRKYFPPQKTKMTGWDNPPWLSRWWLCKPPNTWTAIPGTGSFSDFSDAEERTKKTHAAQRRVGPFRWVGRSKHGRFSCRHDLVSKIFQGWKICHFWEKLVTSKKIRAQ